MPNISKSVQLTQNELRAWELFNAPHNLTISKIAEKMGKSDTSVNRYLKGYRDKAKPEEIDTTAIQREKRLEDRCWQVLEESLEAMKPYGKDAILYPDNAVRLNASVKYLNSKGYLVEQSNMNHTGTVKHEIDMKEKLQKDTMEGLRRFNVNVPLIISDN